VLYGSSLWSSGHRGGYDADGFDDYSAGVLGIAASEEAEGEAVRRAAVSRHACTCFGINANWLLWFLSLVLYWSLWGLYQSSKCELEGRGL
jgi:hypothetical protein